MSSLPLHPALVHVPLGLAFVLPLLAPLVAWAVATGRLPGRAWLLIVLLQATLLGGGLLARWAGEQDEERVEAVVGEAPLARHEAAADAFLWGTAGALALALAAAAMRGGPAQTARVGTVAAAVVVAVLGLRVGHAGGELVYRHGAAAVHSPAEARGGLEAPIGSQPAGEDER